MNKEELINRVNFVLGDGHKELQLFGFVSNDDNPYRISISTTLEAKLLGVIAEGIKTLIIDNNYEIISFSTADERKNRYYEYDLDDKPERMYCMSTVIGNHSVEEFNLNPQTITTLDALIFLISDGDGKAFTVYKVLSSVEKVVKSSKTLLARIGIGNSILDEEQQPIIKIGPKFQIIFTESDNEGTYVFLESSIVESKFDLKQILSNQAARDIGIIQNTNLLNDITKLQHYAQKASFSRKLVGVMRSSKVIKDSIPKNRVLKFIENDEELKTKLRIKIKDEEAFIEINNIESAKAFLDLLNDEFLYSSLTDQKYQAVAKDER